MSSLSIDNLRVYFNLDEGTLKAVDGVNIKINEGETHGIIGESGCGKSVTTQAIMQIVPKPGQIISGKIIFEDNNNDEIDLVALDPSGPKIREIRGNKIAMIFQEPMTSVSPVHTIGNQIQEMLRIHKKLTPSQSKKGVLEIMHKVGIPNPTQTITEYSYQLSGGLRQRAMIAMALSCNPSLLIADEPTTALDETVQAQILDLMKKIQEEFKMSILYITHDLGVIAEIADRVTVMYLGKVVEQCITEELFENPRQPNTSLQLKSLPKRGIKNLTPIEGNVPVPLNFPEMCGFYSRCPYAVDGVCNKSVPDLVEEENDHRVRCFFKDEIK